MFERSADPEVTRQTVPVGTACNTCYRSTGRVTVIRKRGIGEIKMCARCVAAAYRKTFPEEGQEDGQG